MVRIHRQLDRLATAVSLFGLLPVYGSLDLLARIVLPLALLVGAWSDWRRRYLLGPRLATVLSVVVFAVYALQISRQNLVVPALNMAVLLLAVRLLTAKQGRHFLQIFLLASFALAGSTLVSLSLLFLPLMVLLVTGVIYGLVLLCYDNVDAELALDRPAWRTLLRTTLLLPAGSLLLALFFFFILPRTQHPLWDFLNPGRLAGGVGFSEEVRPGSVAETSADTRIAFRAECAELAPEDLYWRTTVLDRYDGSAWVRMEQAAVGPPLVVGGRTLPVTLYPVADTAGYLVTLDVPQTVRARGAVARRDAVYKIPRRGGKGLRSYELQSVVGGFLREPAGSDNDWLYLPDASAPRGRAVAATLRQAGGDRRTRISAVQAFFRSQKLIYATSGLSTAGDPVDTFLFDLRRGYCEHFASSFAVLLRAAGVPARLIGGYYGGDYNPLGGYYMVGERTAHVWVEALLEDGHWQRFDPNQLATRFESGLLAGRKPPAGWQQLADVLDYYWVQAVVALDFNRQFEVAQSLWQAWKSGGRQRLLQFWPWLAGVGILLLSGGLCWRWRRQQPAPAGDRLLRSFIARLERQLGRPRRPQEGLQALARASGVPAAQEFARLYSAALYGDRLPTPAEKKQLRWLLRQLR
jgi:transglutaminase-like putative cysteine protease